MKILMLAEYFYPFAHGGSEWSIYHLVKQLHKKKHNVTILTPNYGAKSKEIWNKICIVRFPFFIKLKKDNPKPVTPYWHTNILWQVITTFYLFKYILRKKVDAIHVQGKFFLPAVIITKFIFKIPVVVTVRDYQVLCPFGFCLNKERHYKRHNILFYFFTEVKQYMKSYPLSPLLFLLYPLIAFRTYMVQEILSFCLEKTDSIIFISRKMKEIFDKNGFFNSQVIYNSYVFPATNSTKKKKTIMYVGRLTKGKGVDLFAEAVRRIYKNTKYTFLIIGSGPLKQDILQIVNKEKLLKRVQLIDYMSYEKVLKCMRESSLVVVPSRWEEPFGRVALEALFQGTPLVVTKRGGLPEIVENKKTGLVVDVTIEDIANGIEKALKKRKEFKRNIVAQQKELEKKFSIDVVNAYEKLYKKVLI